MTLMMVANCLQSCLVLSCLVSSLSSSVLSPSLSSFSVSVLYVLVCVWRAVLLCVVVVCVLCVVCVEVAHSPKFRSRELELNSFIRYSEWLEESGTCCSRPILKLEMGQIQKFLFW